VCGGVVVYLLSFDTGVSSQAGQSGGTLRKEEDERHTLTHREEGDEEEEEDDALRDIIGGHFDYHRSWGSIGSGRSGESLLSLYRNTHHTLQCVSIEDGDRGVRITRNTTRIILGKR